MVVATATNWRFDPGNPHAEVTESLACDSCGKPLYDREDGAVGVVAVTNERVYLHVACAKREGVLW